MFTGIIQNNFEVSKIEKKTGLYTIEIIFESLLENFELGISISIDGVCLTAVSILGNKVTFDAMQETLDKTSLGELEVGSRVNVERSAKQGDEIGGHITSGHVEGTAEISHIIRLENNYIIEFKCPDKWMKYIISKGFIAINGASLTVVNAKEKGTFEVHFIPETLRKTTFSEKKIGDKVNLEIDNQTKLIVHTVERYLENSSIS
ncbi:MAG: Riboflavin synthase [Chlamydiae bacterium]|nr:Riboflavin synthase [Chlamydiota bacterium]